MMKMEEDQDLIFICKLCNYKFPTGESLRGHILSHVVTPNSPESEEKLSDPTLKKASLTSNGGYGEIENGQTSYGLRENPRKTWRVSGANTHCPLQKICKQCGKGFQSLKALCGHMACHSEREKAARLDHSWSTTENRKFLVDSLSETGDQNRENQAFQDRSSKGKKIEKIAVGRSPFTSLNDNSSGSSSVSEIDCDNQEEIAMCLMMLSRDFGSNMTSVVESSDNNSVTLLTRSSSIDMRIRKMEFFDNVGSKNEAGKTIEDLKLKKELALDVENSDSGYFLDEFEKANSDMSVEGGHKKITFFARFSQFGDDFGEKFFSRGKSYNVAEEVITKELELQKNFLMPSNPRKIEPRKEKWVSKNPKCLEKRVKYECFDCKKTFESYQALGGHHPCHERTNPFYESGENSSDEAEELKTRKKMRTKKSNEKKGKSKMSKGRKCPFCDRVFKNGQALGGHKRSHLIGSHSGNYNYNYHSNNIDNNGSQKVEKMKPDLLNLNLPAPQDDEDDGDLEFLDRF